MLATQTLTFGSALAKSGFSIPPHLEASAEVPVITGRPQAQGDLLIVPMSMTRQAASLKFGEWTQVTAKGVSVVDGEATGGHRHDLHVQSGSVSYRRILVENDENPVIMQIRVDAGSAAVIIHSDEHGANALGAPTDSECVYLVTGKREFADQVSRRVAD
jgi:hypothetical protein